jgi:hypothetical protein
MQRIDGYAYGHWGRALGLPAAPVLLPVFCPAADGSAFPGAGGVYCACHLIGAPCAERNEVHAAQGGLCFYASAKCKLT